MSNPWFQEPLRPAKGGARVRHRRQSERATLGERVMVELRRDVWAAIVTGPVVVPLWWALWKICDGLWSLR